MKLIKETIPQFYEYLASELDGLKLEEEQWAFSVFEDYLMHFSSLCNKEASVEEEKLSADISMLGRKELHEFLHLFIIKQVASSEEDVNAFIDVIERYIAWLYNKKYIDGAKKSDFDEEIASCDNLGLAARLSEELFDILTEENEGEYSKKVSSPFVIQGFTGNFVTLKDIKTDTVYKKVIFPEAVMEFILKGMIVDATIGEKDDKIYIISAGKVYLKEI